MKREVEEHGRKRKTGGQHVAEDQGDTTPPSPCPQPEMSALAQLDPDETLSFRCFYHVNQTRQLTRRQLVADKGNPFCPVCAPMRRMADDWRRNKDLGR